MTTPSSDRERAVVKRPSALSGALVAALAVPLMAAPTRGQDLAAPANDKRQPSAAIDDGEVVEGDSGETAAVFTVTVSPLTRDVRVAFTTQDQTATVADGDYPSASGSLLFSFKGSLTRTISVPVRGDTRVEPDETFLLVLTEVEGRPRMARGVGIGTILNDDENNVVRIAAADPVSEGDGSARVIVERVTPSGEPAHVTVNARGGSATENTDFTPVTAVVSWAADEGGPQTVQIPLLDDNLAEGDETIRVTLSAPVEATLGSPSAVNLVLLDDDQEGRPTPTAERVRFLSLVRVPLASAPQQLEALRDGTSNTLMLGERRTGGRLEGCSEPATASLSALGFDSRSPVQARLLENDRIEVRVASRLDPGCVLVGLFTRGWPAKWEAPSHKDAGDKRVDPLDIYVTHDQPEPLPGPKTFHPGVYIFEIGDPTGRAVSGQVSVLGPADFEDQARQGTLRSLQIEASGALAAALAEMDREGTASWGRLRLSSRDGRPLAIEVPNIKVTISMADTPESVRAELRFPRVTVTD